MAATKCLDCKMIVEFCVCGRLPSVPSDVGILIIRHVAERGKASNTGRFLHWMLPNSRLETFGALDSPFDSRLLFEPGTHTEVLFPSRSSPVLRPFPSLTANSESKSPSGDELSMAGKDAPTKRRTLVLLDASWSQARRMVRRVPGLSRVPFVRLPESVPAPVWNVRIPPRSGYYCTLETAIRAFEVLGRDRDARELTRGMEMVRRRLLVARGQVQGLELRP